MNDEEGAQAESTFHFHFNCQAQDIDDGRTYWILENHSTIIGIVGLHHYVWGPEENVWLAWFAVDPNSQGKGLGKYLFDSATALAWEQGYRKLFIETYSSPEFAKARAFYQAQGCTETGRIKAYMPGDDDMVVYSKPIIPPYATVPQRNHYSTDRSDSPRGFAYA